LLHDGQYDLAEEAFQTHNTFFPEYASGYMGLGDVYAHQGEISTASGNYNKAMELDPRMQWLAVVIDELGDVQD
jgi:Flp pilus assembly protein TadD